MTDHFASSPHSAPPASPRPLLALTAEKNRDHKARNWFNRSASISMPIAKLRSGLLAAGPIAALLLMVPGFGIAPALADLRLCNKTTNRVGVSIGYKDKKTWTTEGWWNIPVNSCETLVSGTLVSRFYYVYAVDYDHGGEWSGKYVMCTKDKMFTIEGTEDCVARGFNRSGFFEVDTGEQTNWTIQLNEPAQAGAKTQ
ncbi:DUF1036 domain-containing protein [Mesorhizobium sp. BR1-1-16]|uniref:DUF1036 domain-containing protein n=1 Tax=Mesorhizobium sp. BR1-1-16 TaxID=2876653 RepID=UPI001CCF839B|nr:DUF1036 domain-containing protein [Mesorhizobium sp. BR1-1-16]MBZ9936754.1 DUF1036 domain-containing protein [Mesorhizobium sp. BR1-1-16]